MRIGSTHRSAVNEPAGLLASGLCPEKVQEWLARSGPGCAGFYSYQYLAEVLAAEPDQTGKRSDPDLEDITSRPVRASWIG